MNSPSAILIFPPESAFLTELVTVDISPVLKVSQKKFLNSWMTPILHTMRCSLEGHGEAERVMSLQTADSIREIEEALRQIIEQAEGRR